MKEYDFYYSQQMFEHKLAMDEFYRPRKFKGKPYTICTQKGEGVSNYEWTDILFLGSGTYDDISN